MGQNILVAFDDSENAMRAVEFIVKSFTPQNKITLLHVFQDAAALCEMNSPELSDYFLSQQTAFCALEDKKKRLVDNAMEKAKAIFLDAGFGPSDITLKMEAKNKGVARDIVDEAQSGYDIIVVGRRGLSAIKEFFFGSISQKVINGVKDVSVLIVN